MKPILFQWGPVTLYAYGLMMAVGFLLCLADVRRRGRTRGVDAEQLTNVAFAALLGGIAGARALYVALDWSYFVRHPLEMVLLNHGGLVWYGGFAGGVLAAFLYTRVRGLAVGLTFDIFMPGLALAQAAGRIGCFLNGCCYGFEAHPPLGICLPEGLGCRFPVQLLNTALLLLLFVALDQCFRRVKQTGNLIWFYGIGYGTIRFVTEYFRGDQTTAALGLSLPQLMSAILFLVSGFVLLCRAQIQAGLKEK
jgi:phosphatidylglycerol:prolipoprotein diacylglycerol transferase